ncbi:MAG: FtsX-like permease family protein [Steroidobacteraceae bacterium]
MIIPRLALLSLWNRRSTVVLTVCGIAVSVALLLGVEKIRTDMRTGFANTISGADLIVGARSGPVNLLLYSIFRIGDATNGVSWKIYQRIAAHPDVAWTIPLSLGDSHRGYRVLGTNNDYFTHYRFAQDRTLAFTAGGPFTGRYDAVVGAEVASALHYTLGQSITLAHGVGEVSFANHADKPFVVTGILARTGTPADRTVHVTLEAIEALHAHAPAPPVLAGPPHDAEPGLDAGLTPDSITAFIVGLKNRVAAFQIQRDINEFRGEPLLAILPGVTLQQLWQVVGIAETALLVVAGCVVFAGLLGMLTAVLTSLNERRREMAILRSVGARPTHVFLLMMSEAALLGGAGVVVGMALLHAAVAVARPLLESRYGVFLSGNGITVFELAIGGVVIAAALLAGAIPAWRAYRNTLADGLTIRV